MTSPTRTRCGAAHGTPDGARVTSPVTYSRPEGIVTLNRISDGDPKVRYEDSRSGTPFTVT